MNCPGCEKEMKFKELADGFQYWCVECDFVFFDDEAAKVDPKYEAMCGEFNGTFEEMVRVLKLRSFQ